jgi:hypothetical protein
LSRRARTPEFLGWSLLGAAVLGSAAVLFWLGRGLTFAYDEFAWLEIGGLSALHNFFHPYGGHLIVLPYYVFRGMLELFGASYTAFSIVQVIGLSLVAVLVYIYCRRRIGPLLALAPPIVLLFIGGSYPVLLEPMIGIQFLAAVLPGFAAVVVLELEDRRWDVAACVLLCLSLAGFSESVPFVIGAALVVALSPNWKRRLWILAIPILGYAYWRHWAAQFESTGIVASNIPLLPAYFVDALAVFAAAIFGAVAHVGAGPWSEIRLSGYRSEWLWKGIAFTIAELIAIAVGIWALMRRGPIPRTLWPALGMLAALCAELGVILAPGRTAAEPRYLYAGAMLLMLVVVELLRGVRTTRLTVAIAAALTLLAVGGNVARFRDAREFLDDYTHEARADMTVIRLAGLNGDQALTPNIDLPYSVPGGLILNSGPWLLVEERYGSQAYSVAELQAQSEAVREEADRVATRSLRLKPKPAPALPRSGCRTLAPGAAGAALALPPGGATLESTAPAELSLRRWASDFSVELKPLEPGSPQALTIPADAARVPWRLRIEGGGKVSVCGPTQRQAQSVPQSGSE